MSILSDLFKREDRPGPGVAPDEPRKKGLRRLWEVCTRDLGSFFWAGLLALAGLAAWYFLTVFALLILGNVWLPLTAALLAVYRPMEQALDLEKQVRAVQEERRGRQ